MEINFFGTVLQDSEIKSRLTENDFVMEFTLKQKVYYKFIRPVLPHYIRKKLQKKVSSNISFKENFIYDEFVNLVRDNISNNEQTNIYPKGYNSSVILTHDVEEETGFNFIPKVIKLEQKYGFRSSWNIVPYKYKIDGGIINLIRETKNEIGIHGYNHDGKLYLNEKIFNSRAKFINDAIEKYNAVGFRSPMVHRNLKWLQKLNIKYDSSCFDYDPFQPFPGGTGSIWPFIAGKFVELPYTLPQDHTIFYILKQNDISIWKNKIKWIIENNGIVLVLTHPDYLDNNKHFKMYEDLLIFLKQFKDSWHCLPKEMADWWHNNFSN